ncbi:MAG: hypothetical protein IPF58_01355 [Saprospirales bacterium]|nr:hypothetical protein [Saprospirales bacterium]
MTSVTAFVNNNGTYVHTNIPGAINVLDNATDGNKRMYFVFGKNDNVANPVAGVSGDKDP